MSMGASAALQAAIYQVLSGDAALQAIVGTAVHDEVPPGPISGTSVSIGAGDVRDTSDVSGAMAEHSFVVTINSDAEGFAEGKAAAAAVSDALVDARPVLARGRVVGLHFVRAKARRVRAGQARRIDMTFRAIVEDT